MAVTWTTPRTWIIEEPINVSKLNTELSGNMNYLYNRPATYVTIKGDGTNLTNALTTFSALDDAQFTLNLTTTSGRVEFILNAMVSRSAAGILEWDVLIDDSTYASSGTATPVTNGLGGLQVTTTVDQLNGRFRIDGLTPGLHTFKLRVRNSAAGTATVYLSGYFCQFGVREV